MMARQVNGSGRSHDDDVGKIASLDEARKCAARAAKEAQRAERTARRGGAMGARDWIVGGLFVAMALGMVWHWLSPLVVATGGTR